MKSLGLAAALALMPATAFAQGGPSSTESCDRGGVLSAGGLGPLRIGMTIDSLARACRIVERLGPTSTSSTRYAVRVGADTVHAWEVNGRVDWIAVTSPVHRTRDSLGVGTTVARLLMLPGVAGGPGDGTDTYAVYAASGEHCGITFWLDSKTAEVMRRTKGDVQRALGMRGGGGVVVEVNVRGPCTR